MLGGSRREAWQHTSSILALLANIHRDPEKKKEPFTAMEFNPALTAAEKEQIDREHRERSSLAWRDMEAGWLSAVESMGAKGEKNA